MEKNLAVEYFIQGTPHPHLKFGESLYFKTYLKNKIPVLTFDESKKQYFDDFNDVSICINKLRTHSFFTDYDFKIMTA